MITEQREVDRYIQQKEELKQQHLNSQKAEAVEDVEVELSSDEKYKNFPIEIANRLKQVDALANKI